MNIPLFFLVGPLRTGSSLASRCIDDHPDIICLCESEINRTLFPEYYLKLHWARMYRHGFQISEMMELLDRKKQNDISDLSIWYQQIFPKIKILYKKPSAKILGDKSPDYYRSKELVGWLAKNYPLIYTVRDPRAILRSIEAQNDSTQIEKRNRWRDLIDNYSAWAPLLKQENILISRFEDLVKHPEKTMRAIYSHVGVDYSDRFMQPFKRLHPERFLWKTAIDWESGIRKDFDVRKTEFQDTDLTDEQLEMVYSNPTMDRFMKQFEYKA